MARSSRFRRGNSILEFAIAAGVLVPVFAGTFQFGYTFYIYNNLDTAIRGGARYASLRSYDSRTSTPSANFSTAVQNMVVYGNIAGTGDPIAAGLSTANVQVLPVMNGAVPRAMTVQITGYTVDAIFTKFTFTGKPSTTFSYTGTAAPCGAAGC
jgi:Flp pilus assembly protein TadG